VKELPNKIHVPILSPKSPPINEGIPFKCWSDLILPRNKAEALLPILAIACLNLNSSSVLVDKHKHIMQSVFACALFFNRAKLLPFPIHSRMKRSDFTPKAMDFLHGKRLMDHLSPSEETFVRFVILLDIMRYHPDALEATLDKYSSLFTIEEKQSVLDFINSYTCGRVEIPPFSIAAKNRKVVKGYRSNDIALFIKIKKKVLEERHHVNTVMSEVDGSSQNGSTNAFPENQFNVLPFTFDYHQVNASIKIESFDSVSNKKRKFHQSDGGNTSSASLMAMEFDDGDVCFDYSTKSSDFEPI